MPFERMDNMRGRSKDNMNYVIRGGRGYIRFTALWTQANIPKATQCVVFFIDNERRVLGARFYNEYVVGSYSVRVNKDGFVEVGSTNAALKLKEFGYPERDEIVLQQRGAIWEMRK